MRITLPEMGEDIREGRVAKWLVQEGQSVQADDEVVEIQTDKATLTLGAPRDGQVLRFFASVDAQVLVGAPLYEMVPNAPDLFWVTPRDERVLLHIPKLGTVQAQVAYAIRGQQELWEIFRFAAGGNERAWVVYGKWPDSACAPDSCADSGRAWEAPARALEMPSAEQLKLTPPDAFLSETK